VPLPDDRRRRRTSIHSPIACPPSSTVTTMMNITLGAQCIGLYECPPRKIKKDGAMENSCRDTGTGLRERNGWKAMESTQILLRYFVNAASEQKGRERWSTRLECPTTKNIMFLGQKTSHEIFLYPPRSATPSPNPQNFTYAPSSPRYRFKREAACNRIPWYIKMSIICQYNRNLV